MLIPLTASADCYSMLGPVFTVAKQPTPPTIYATVTKHYASGSQTDVHDPVRYSNGALTHANLWWPSGSYSYIAETLHGTIDSRQNTSSNTQMDMFAPKGLSLKFALTTTGQISVQELLNGVPIGGMPPRYYGATCSAGLVTVVDDKNVPADKGGTFWSISLTTTPYLEPPK